MSGLVRHVACKLCRDRKVRCDGGQPRCQRCTRAGEECVYTMPAKHSKNDLAATVEMLGARLSQAEAALSLQSTRTSTPTTFAHPPFVPFVSAAYSNSAAPATATDQLAAPVSVAPFSLDALPPLSVLDHTDSVCFDFALPDADADISPITQWVDNSTQPSSIQAPQACFDPFDGGQSTQDLANRDTQDLIPAELLGARVQNDLNHIYFHAVDPTFPVVDRAECDVALDDPAVPLEMCGLKLASWAHAALRCRSYAHVVDTCYTYSRRCLERVELENPAASTSITALQAYILVALFEFKKGIFNRAWVSVNRASWIAQLLGLHRMDSGSPRAPTGSGAHLERCRRTFWAAFVLDMFIRVGSRWSPRMIDESEISTYLPDCLPSEPITLDDALALPATGKLQPLQGFILAMAICGRCVCHVDHLNREKSPKVLRYDFWANHHSLSEVIDNARRFALEHFKLSTLGMDPMVLSTHAVLYAAEVCLCEAVDRKSAAMSAGQDFRSDNMQRWVSAVTGLIDVVHRISHVESTKMHHFTPWTIYVTVQACIRQLYHRRWRQDADPPRPSSLNGFSSSSAGSSEADSLAAEPTRTQLLDWIHLLLCVLSTFQTSNAFARIFEVEGQRELRHGAEFLHDRVVGFVNFPVVAENIRIG